MNCSCVLSNVFLRPQNLQQAEIIIILEGVDTDPLNKFAERIRLAVAENLGRRSGLDEPVTISLGGTIAESEDQSIENVIHRADEALYRAKSSGRNRVVLLNKEA